MLDAAHPVAVADERFEKLERAEADALVFPLPREMQQPRNGDGQSGGEEGCVDEGHGLASGVGKAGNVVGEFCSADGEKTRRIGTG